ncbi:MAG: hypothetical protein ACTHMS_08930 [Jatrophihabitans sp.]|uniref:glycine-rich domain-containing protein n=1 Tax=Jatrophihabitans sp. TaxID=1932789 RepID=UPI003F81B1F3
MSSSPRPLPHLRPRPRPAAHAAPDRRTVLRAGMVTAAGAGVAALAVAAPAAAATVAATAVTTAPPPSGSDDTAALQAAMPDTGVLLLQAGTYQLAGRLLVGDGQDLRGAGGGFGASATVLRCTTSAAGVEFSRGGGTSSGFRVDAGSLATRPFARTGGLGGCGRMFSDITVWASAGDGIVALAAQNDVWTGVSAAGAARDALLLDQGYGGALFSRCEFAAAGRYNLHFAHDVPGGPYPTPADLMFEQCIVETSGTVGTGLALIDAAYDVKFHHTAFWTEGAMAGPLIDVTGRATQISIGDALIGSGASPASDTGLRVDDACHVLVDGVTRFNGLQAAFALRSGTPHIEVRGGQVYEAVQQRYTTETAMDPQSWINTSFSEPLVSTRSAAGDLAYVSLAAAGTGFHVVEAASGRRTWGSGHDWSGDVALDRRAAGVLGVDAGHLLATGYGTTADRPAPTPATAGSLRLNTDTRQLEVTDGTDWFPAVTAAAATTQPPAALPQLRAATFTASGRFTVPDGVTSLRVQAIGAGGGGGGGGTIGGASRAPSAHGGAGGGAGLALDQVVPVTPGDVITVSVGAGGVGGGGGAATSRATGNGGAPGRAGGTTTVRRGAGTVLLAATGGGGGHGAPGSSMTAAVPANGAGAVGCADVVGVNGLPGCGGLNGGNALPAPTGVCGGAAGGDATRTRGGSGGTASTSPGARAVAGAATMPNANGGTGARPTQPGCGGNGGGAGGRAAHGGAGGAGSDGWVQLSWVG